MRTLAFTLLIPLLATGCAEPEPIIKADTTPAFADGYRDGCASGSAATLQSLAKAVKDEARYNADPDYAVGWQNGNRECDGGSLDENPNNPMEQIDTFGQEW
jgi:hypothetical protein